MRRFLLIALLQATLISLFHFYFHEPWRDEVQHWLIARDTVGLPALFEALRYEGHPPLLHFLMKAAAFVFAGPVVLALVAGLGYLAVSLATYFLFLSFRISERRSFLAALLVSWTFSSAYELGVIARGYGLGMGLALGGWAAGLAGRRKTAALLFILGTFTSIPAALLIFILCFGLSLRAWGRREKKTAIALLALPVPFLAYLVKFLWLAPDRVSSLTKGAFSFPAELPFAPFVSLGIRRLHDFEYHFAFPTHWWNLEYSPWLKAIGEISLVAATLGALVLGLKKYRRQTTLCLTTTLVGLLGFEFLFRFVHPASFRQTLFIVFPLFLLVGVFWLREWEAKRNAAWVPISLLLVAVTTQILAAGLSFSADYTWYFSQTAMARDLLPANRPIVVVSDSDDMAVPLALWLPQARFVSRVANGRPFTFVRWDRARQAELASLDSLFQNHCADRPASQLFYVTTKSVTLSRFALRRIFTAPATARTSIQEEAFAFYSVDCDHPSQDRLEQWQVSSGSASPLFFFTRK